MPLAYLQLALPGARAGDLEARDRGARAGRGRLRPLDARDRGPLASHLNDAGRFKEAAALLEPYAADRTRTSTC